MSEQVYGEGVEFGDEIGPLVKTPTAEQVQAFLAVWTRAWDSALNVSVAFFNDGEEHVVAERLRAALAG